MTDRGHFDELIPDMAIVALSETGVTIHEDHLTPSYCRHC